MRQIETTKSTIQSYLDTRPATALAFSILHPRQRWAGPVGTA